ncbi:hypothetical protein GF376_05215, partial [Candidatus Peregrinibacteria bacterium]|nr:hypothetical protein [Candidatus Peregrinibacteria bacterium]
VNLYRRGLFIADQNNNVRPNDSITREEFIKLDLGGICIICDNFAPEIQNSVWNKYSRDPFNDQSEIADQYRYCVAEGKNRNIISGYASGNYEPELNISRAEAAKVILITAKQRVNDDIVFSTYNLVGKPWWYNYVITAHREGLFPRDAKVDVNGQNVPLNNISPADFKKILDQQLFLVENGLSSQFIDYFDIPPGQNGSFDNISRREFAMMVAEYTDRYDCLEDDQDGDLLPDNYERYIYGTDPLKRDTDGGGVIDSDEIIRGGDPLNAADDDAIQDTDGGGVFDQVEIERGTDPTDPSDDRPLEVDNNVLDTDGGGVNDDIEIERGTDPTDPSDDRPGENLSSDDDNDGISGVDEIALGTDPNNPDTDGGGINDGDELLLGLDPLDAADDQYWLNGEGVFVSGLEVFPNSVYKMPNLQGVSNQEILTEDLDYIPADGNARLHVGATIYDSNGEVMTDDNESVVRFAFLEAEDYEYAEFEAINVQVENGYAETIVTSKNKIGFPTIIATIDGANVPSQKKTIEVHALEPDSMIIVPESSVIPAGGLSKTEVVAQMFDQHNNLTNNGTYQVNFTLVNADGEETLAKIDPKLDEDQEKPGTQISSVTGEYRMDIISGVDSENLILRGEYQAPAQQVESQLANPIANILIPGETYVPLEVSFETEIRTSNDLSLMLIPEKDVIKADNSDYSTIAIRVLENGQIEEDFNGEVSLGVLNSDVGKFINNNGFGSGMTANQNMEIENGEAKIRVYSTVKAGEIIVTANVDGLNPAETMIESSAYQPAKIILESREEEIEADPEKTYQINAKLFDANNNFVKGDSETQISLTIEPESTEYANLVGETTAIVENGEISFFISPKKLTGPIRLRAKSDGLVDGYLEIMTVKRIFGEDLREIEPKVLFASLLGSEFGNINIEDYFAGWMVFSGKTQAVTSL